MPWLSGLPIDDIVRSGAPWLLVFVFMMGLFTGRLRTRRELDSLSEMWAERLRESKEHASGLLKIIEGYRELDRKRDERWDDLLEGSRVITSTLRSLPEVDQARQSTPEREREQRDPRGRRPGPPRGGRER